MRKEMDALTLTRNQDCTNPLLHWRFDGSPVQELYLVIESSTLHEAIKCETYVYSYSISSSPLYSIMVTTCKLHPWTIIEVIGMGPFKPNC